MSGPQIGPPRLLYKPTPLAVHVADLSLGTDRASITDIETADFDADGQKDVAVAWYATDYDDMSANQRYLTVFFGDGTDLARVVDIDLYVPNYTVEPSSIFRNGTSDIGVGDFDGDGDPDLAVLPYFGDEVWFVENLGDRQFAAYLQFPYGYNSNGNFLTPPEALTADFDGDGRAELVYLADPVQRYDDRLIHFWKTDSSIANMVRVDWWTTNIGIYWTRGLAVADFDGDTRPDLCFTGSFDPEESSDPVIQVWYNLNVGSGTFETRLEYPSMLCSDVASAKFGTTCPAGLLLTDLDGTRVQYWAHDCAGSVGFSEVTEVTGYAGLSPDRGMTGVVADVDGDGHRDLVTKQKSGEVGEADQIEITTSSSQGNVWWRIWPNPIDTTGWRNSPYNGILRPRNLAVADLFGSTLPEIVAGFGASKPLPVGDGVPATLDIAIWENGCLGDVTRDGRTLEDDVVAANAALDKCVGEPGFNANADVDKSRCVDATDLALITGDLGCEAYPCAGQRLGDANCDGSLNGQDIDAFILAITAGQAEWEAVYGSSGCQFLCVMDLNDDGSVNGLDVELFVDAISH